MQPEELEYANDILCEGDISVRQAYIKQGTAKEHYRPYLVLDGEVTGIRGNFPHGVSEVHFADEHRSVKVSYQYHFTNQELASMCEKGLFDDGFTTPDIFCENNGFQLPMRCDCFVVKNTKVPLLFVNVQSPFNMEIESKTCGYTLGDYFEQAVQKESEFLEDAEMESISFDEEESLFVSDEKTQLVETKETEDVKELSTEDKILNQAFENIEERVEHKVLQAKQNVKSMDEESDEEMISDDVLHDPMVESVNDSESSKFVDDDFVEDDTFLEEDEIDEDSAVSESEQESEQEKKKSSASKTAISDIKEAVAEEIHREVPSEISDIEKASDELSEDNDDDFML